MLPIVDPLPTRRSLRIDSTGPAIRRFGAGQYRGSRENTGSFLQFLKVAQGSLKELETHLMLADRIVVSAGATTPVLDRCEVVGKMLNGLIRSLQRHGTGESE